MTDKAQDMGSEKSISNVVKIDEERIKGHLDRIVRGTVEETLNGLLDAEADALCGAQRYERSPDRIDTRAGHYNLITTQAAIYCLLFNRHHRH